ncbi:MAG: hypothetical protein CFH38_00416 [Alphaproteobacteria bacterium MarineAlpha10_Bin1]|nr:MAG: hypothetical protein CFH38_00416 [Alphaproteobacteria bacterium MarineAlpha10_Bin1]
MIQPRILRGFAVFALLLAVGITFVVRSGRTESVYTVRDIAVDSSAASAAAARSIALAGGQRTAFDRLMRRIVLSEDRVILPNLDDTMIAQVIDGYEIEKELVSPTRYRANLIVDFNKNQIRKLLRKRKIRFAETRSKDVLVVPVYDAGEGAVLWQEPEDWRAAWLARPANEGLVPFILPLGDVMDMGAVSAAEAQSPLREALLRLAQRYGADEIVVAVASLRLSDERVETGQGTEDGTENGTEEGTEDRGAEPTGQSAADETEPSVSRRVRGPVEGAILQLTVHRVGVAGEQSASELLRGAPAESKADLLSRAVGRVIAQVEGGWKQANILRFGRENKLRIIVPLAGLSDWVDMRRRLSELAVVLTVDLAALSRDQAEVLLHYLGETEQLMLGLEQSDLALNFEARGWVLQNASVGDSEEQGGKNL